MDKELLYKKIIEQIEESVRKGRNLESQIAEILEEAFEELLSEVAS